MGQKASSSVMNMRTGSVVAQTAEEAAGLWASFKGLMFRASMPDDYGLVFRPAMGIHTCFMRYPIDLIYFDKQNRIKKIRSAMKPWRIDLTNAAGVIEMNPGTASRTGLQKGDVLEFRNQA